MTRRFLIISISFFSASLLFAVPQRKEWKLVWSDEFSSSNLNTNKWNIERDFVRNISAQQLYTDNKKNLNIKAGKLVLTALHETAENKQHKPQSKDWRFSRKSADYTSGSVNSRGKMEFKYGKIEIKAKIEHGAGVWPALWLIGLFPGKSWPDCGEIDLLEYISQNKNTVHSTFHFEKSSEKLGAGRTKNQVFPTLLKGYHTYGMEWDDKKIDIVFDGKLFHTLDLSTSQIGNYNAFKNKFYVIMNLAIGGWSEKAKPKDYPKSFYIDYIRVYQDKKNPLNELWINGEKIDPFKPATKKK